MTKTVRVENADVSSYKVVVDTYQQVGEKPDLSVDRLVSSQVLGHPTALSTAGIHSSQYLLVRETN